MTTEEKMIWMFEQINGPIAEYKNHDVEVACDNDWGRRPLYSYHKKW